MKKGKTIVIKGWFLCPLDTKKCPLTGKWTLFCWISVGKLTVFASP